MSTFSTTGSSTTADHRTFPLLSLNPLAQAFLVSYQFPSNPLISLCNSTTMSLPFAQTFCGKPPSANSSHAPPITRLIAGLLHAPRFSSRITHLSRMQKLFNPLLDLHLFCSHPSNIGRNVYRRFARPFNCSTNTWRQNNSTGGHYKFLSFKFRMTLLYCATCFSLWLEQLTSAIPLLKAPPSVHKLS